MARSPGCLRARLPVRDSGSPGLAARRIAVHAKAPASALPAGALRVTEGTTGLPGQPAGSAAALHSCRCRSGRWTWPRSCGKSPRLRLQPPCTAGAVRHHPATAGYSSWPCRTPAGPLQGKAQRPERQAAPVRAAAVRLRRPPGLQWPQPQPPHHQGLPQPQHQGRTERCQACSRQQGPHPRQAACRPDRSPETGPPEQPSGRAWQCAGRRPSVLSEPPGQPWLPEQRWLPEQTSLS